MLLINECFVKISLGSVGTQSCPKSVLVVLNEAGDWLVVNMASFEQFFE